MRILWQPRNKSQSKAIVFIRILFPSFVETPLQRIKKCHSKKGLFLRPQKWKK